MTVSCHPDLRYLALQSEVESAVAFSIMGRRVEAGAHQLLTVLESELYHRLYCGSAAAAAPYTVDPAESLVFIGALSLANTGDGTWEPGWTISRTRDTAIRDGIEFCVDRQSLRPWSARALPGEPCSVRIGKEMRHLVSGFYMALGNRHPEDEDGERSALLRLYWHLTPQAAIHYMRVATARLNEADIPFMTKVLSSPRDYVRRDSGVLYLRRNDFERAVPALRQIYAAVGAALLSEVPLFTKGLAPGLALAEDPGNGMSFGQSRCRIAARGLWQCHEQALVDPGQRVSVIAGAFSAEGIDPDRPYLAPGSADRYEVGAGFGVGLQEVR